MIDSSVDLAHVRLAEIASALTTSGAGHVTDKIVILP
jgi:hypothetical protein